MGFVTALIERLVAERVADPARVFVVGTSPRRPDGVEHGVCDIRAHRWRRPAHYGDDGRSARHLQAVPPDTAACYRRDQRPHAALRRLDVPGLPSSVGTRDDGVLAPAARLCRPARSHRAAPSARGRDAGRASRLDGLRRRRGSPTTLWGRRWGASAPFFFPAAKPAAMGLSAKPRLRDSRGSVAVSRRNSHAPAPER